MSQLTPIRRLSLRGFTLTHLECVAHWAYILDSHCYYFHLGRCCYCSLRRRPLNAFPSYVNWFQVRRQRLSTMTMYNHCRSDVDGDAAAADSVAFSALFHRRWPSHLILLDRPSPTTTMALFRHLLIAGCPHYLRYYKHQLRSFDESFPIPANDY